MILVGPSRNQEVNVGKVRELLQNLAREQNIQFTRSTIPYVSTA